MGWQRNFKKCGAREFRLFSLSLWSALAECATSVVYMRSATDREHYFIYVVVGRIRSFVLGWQDILFCNFWLGAGFSELQMCMSFSVGFYLVIIISTSPGFNVLSPYSLVCVLVSDCNGLSIICALCFGKCFCKLSIVELKVNSLLSVLT